MNNGLERLGRFSLAALIAAPLVVAVLVCAVIEGLLSVAWAVRHPTRWMEDRYAAAAVNWIANNQRLNRIADAWEGLIRKILKM